MIDERKRVVQAGYDALAERFVAWSAAIQGDPRARFCEELERRLEDGARVLDLGCGAGVPLTRRLAERFEVVGVDLSEEQLRLAGINVSAATLVHGDFARLDFPGGSFDAVTAFYSITHVPRQEHEQLIGRIARWLKPGGLFLASLGARAGEDWTGEWLGVPMFFSSFGADTNRRLLDEAGYTLLLDEVVSMLEPEPEGEARFLWVLARTQP